MVFLFSDMKILIHPTSIFCDVAYGMLQTTQMQTISWKKIMHLQFNNLLEFFYLIPGD